MKIEELIALHNKENDGRIKDRIKAVIYAKQGYRNSDIALLLFKSVDSIQNYLKEFEEKGKFDLAYKGRAPILTDEESTQLAAYVKEHMISDKKQIMDYVKKTFNKTLAPTTCYNWLKNNGFSYKMPEKVPQKADSVLQQKAIEHYDEVVNEVLKTENDLVLFMDAVHPTQSLKTSAAWLQKGIRKIVPTSSARIRLNIISALNLEEMHLTSEFYDTINEDAVCDFFVKLRKEYSHKGKIHMFLDNAAYQKTEKVLKVSADNNIVLHFLPLHSLNLNPTERVWKVMNKHVRNNVFFEKAKHFRNAIKVFLLETFNKIGKTLVNTINDCFQIINPIDQMI